MRESATPNPSKVKFFELVKNPDFLAKTREEQAKELGVCSWTLWSWSKELDWDQIKAEIRKQYGKFAPSVDMALIRKAQKGSEKAIELFYQRFEEWSVKQISELIHHRGDLQEASDDELIRSLVKSFGKERLKKFLVEEAPQITEIKTAQIEESAQNDKTEEKSEEKQ